MKCSGSCGKTFKEEEVVYQVRAGKVEEVKDTFRGTSEDEFVPDSDVGYYCSECLAKGGMKWQ